MPLVASLALPVAAVRARGLDRGACDLLADRRVLLLPRFLTHSRPRSEVADLESRSGLSRGPDGLGWIQKAWISALES